MVTCVICCIGGTSPHVKSGEGSRQNFHISRKRTKPNTTSRTNTHIDKPNKFLHIKYMSSPTKAYDLLETIERDIVDDYVKFVKQDQKSKSERIALALGYAIPTEHVRRSKGALNKPIIRVAITEKIQELADNEDLSPTRVIREHAAIAFSSLKDYIEPANFGEFKIKELDDIPDEKMGAIKTIRTVPTAYGMRTEIIMHDKLPSLKIMAELMGLIASDRPPVLEGYAKPKTDDKQLGVTPEKAYTELLESLNA